MIGIWREQNRQHVRQVGCFFFRFGTSGGFYLGRETTEFVYFVGVFVMKSAVLLISAFAVALASGCAFKKPDPEAEKKEKAAEKVLSDFEERQRQQDAAWFSQSEIKFEFVPQLTPTKYTIRVSWPERLRNTYLEVDDIETALTGPNFYERSATSGEKIKILLVSKDNRNVERKRVEVWSPKVPLDHVFEKTVELHQDENIVANRVFFLDRTLVYLKGFNLSLKANEIVFENAIIRSDFPDSRKTTRDERLLKGALLHIDAGKSLGDVSIFMTGIDGAPGRNGDVLRGPVQLDGEDGANGDAEKLGLQVPCNSNEPCPFRFTCIKQPTDGKRGKDGGKGWDGERGSDGGNSGSVEIQIQDFAASKFDIYLRAGLAGIGGLGEKAGGKGGRGGNAIKSKSPGLSTCVPAKDGANGDNGGPGSDGGGGSEGKLGKTTFPTIPGAELHFILH